MVLQKLNPQSPILVAENDPGTRADLMRIFSDFQLENVSFESEFHKVVSQAKTEPMVLLFLSSSLDQGDALNTLQSIRESGRNTDTPIIFMHQTEEGALAEQAREHGASHTLEKPIETEVIQKVFEDLLNSYAVSAQETEKREKQDLSATETALERGQRYLDKEDYQGAEAAFQEAMVTGGGKYEVYSGLIEVYLRQGEIDKGLQALAEVERFDIEAKEKLHPLEESFMDRGNRDLRDGDFEQAAREFEAVISLNEENVEAHIGLGESLHGMGDEEGARKAFEKALAVNERPEDLHVYNRLGIAARKNQDYEQAHRAYDKALSFDERDPVLYYNKSLVYISQKQLKASLLLLKKALEYDPDFEQAKTLGQTIVRAWKKSQADQPES